MIGPVRAALRDESGFTLPELLLSTVIGIVIVLAAFMLLDSSGTLALNVADRQDAAQRARIAMQTITSQLRSQVCLAANDPAINAGSDGSNLVFYTFTGSGTFLPERHKVAFDSSAGTLTEYDYVPTGTFPTLTFPTSATKNVTLLEAVQPASAGAPIFTYYTWTTSGQVAATNQLPVPLSATDAARTVKVSISFQASPAGRPTSTESTTLQDDVFSRTADPNASAGPSVTAC